jgi:hypothetical protein
MGRLPFDSCQCRYDAMKTALIAKLYLVQRLSCSVHVFVWIRVFLGIPRVSFMFTYGFLQVFMLGFNQLP